MNTHMAVLKRKQVRIYLDAESERRLAKMIGGIKTFSETQIVSEIVAAALEACEKDGLHLRLPMTFEIVDPPHPLRRHELNEPKPEKRK